jgi:hypothetical protein
MKIMSPVKKKESRVRIADQTSHLGEFFFGSLYSLEISVGRSDNINNE